MSRVGESNKENSKSKHLLIYLSHLFNARRELKSFVTSTAAKLLNIWR